MKRIRIYTVPKVADRVEEYIALNLGGFTRTDGRGGWVNEAGRLFVEESTVIEVLVPVPPGDHGVLATDIDRVLAEVDRVSAEEGEEMTLVTRESFIDVETRWSS